MLIEKAIEVNDVVSFKLNTGEEIIGNLSQIKANSYLISKPLIIAIKMYDDHSASIHFMPFMASANEDIKVDILQSAMMCLPVKARTDVVNNYRKVTSSIEIPKPGLIL